MASSSQIDKEQLYGEYLNDHRRKSRMAEQLARKSLDLPDADDMQVTNTTTTGLGWKELVAMGVLVGGGAIGGHLLTQSHDRDAITPPPAATHHEHTDTDTVTVLGFDESQ